MFLGGAWNGDTTVILLSANVVEILLFINLAVYKEFADTKKVGAFQVKLFGLCPVIFSIDDYNCKERVSCDRCRRWPYKDVSYFFYLLQLTANMMKNIFCKIRDLVTHVGKRKIKHTKNINMSVM